MIYTEEFSTHAQVRTHCVCILSTEIFNGTPKVSLAVWFENDDEEDFALKIISSDAIREEEEKSF